MPENQFDLKIISLRPAVLRVVARKILGCQGAMHARLGSFLALAMLSAAAASFGRTLICASAFVRLFWH